MLEVLNKYVCVAHQIQNLMRSRDSINIVRNLLGDEVCEQEKKSNKIKVKKSLLEFSREMAIRHVEYKFSQKGNNRVT